MKHKRILAMLLAVASCLSLAVSASAASTARKATDFKDFDRNAWYITFTMQNILIPYCRRRVWFKPEMP